jgi:hypothetical protein
MYETRVTLYLFALAKVIKREHPLVWRLGRDATGATKSATRTRDGSRPQELPGPVAQVSSYLLSLKCA